MTLKDIAGMAGVSVATVSYVLNHRDNKVSPEVAARVRSIMREVNYQPNTMAKALRSSKARIIGVLTEDLSVWQVGRIVQGATHYAEAHGYSIVISDLGLKAKIGKNYDSIYQYGSLIDESIKRLRAIQVGGIVFVGMHDRNLNGLIRADVPVVHAYCSTEQTDDVQVRYDNRKISREVVSMLLSQYGGQIGIIDGPIESAPARQRMAGVEEAYAQAGIPMDLQLSRRGDWEYESGVFACEQIISCGHPFRAIYAFNDLMAVGAIKALQRHGIRVPEDVGVIGFDDTDLGMYSSPSLSTVHVPLDEIGKESSSDLITLLENGRLEKKQLCLDCTLIERESYRRPDRKPEETPFDK